ncbi:DUF3703 domain-containing protein [Nocardia asiatica]|uniref:DUF3703 domain-containing protein n=1 Tax=Nocardia asiatica TaxID=209252 RepID=UPI003EE3B80C
MPEPSRHRYHQELQAANTAAASEVRWVHLECAHILTQPRPWPHTHSHLAMFVLAGRQRDRRETFGQVVQIVAATRFHGRPLLRRQHRPRPRRATPTDAYTPEPRGATASDSRLTRMCRWFSTSTNAVKTARCTGSPMPAACGNAALRTTLTVNPQALHPAIIGESQALPMGRIVAESSITAEDLAVESRPLFAEHVARRSTLMC